MVQSERFIRDVKYVWLNDMENGEETGENNEEKTKNSIQLDDFDFDDI